MVRPFLKNGRTPDLADERRSCHTNSMSAPQFQSVVFVHQDTVRLFYLPQKNWHSLDGSFDLAEAAPKEVVERLRGRTFSF